jgi:thiol-disulfide isomerase/thioredoxin
MSRFLTANAVTIVAIIMMALKIHDMFSPLRDIKGSLVKPIESEVSSQHWSWLNRIKTLIRTDITAIMCAKGDWNKEINAAAVGGNIIVIDFYATWCPPCKKAAPRVGQLSIGTRNLVRFRVFDLLWKLSNTIVTSVLNTDYAEKSIRFLKIDVEKVAEGKCEITVAPII